MDRGDAMKSSALLSLAVASSFVAASAVPSFAADDLKLNPHLDYSSDSLDGPLITGSHLLDGVKAGEPNYILIYGEGCYNSKRQARRTVSLYEKYKGRVNFVVVDLDKPHSAAQQRLIDTYYQNAIPDLIVLDAQGKPVYNQAGEQDEDVLGRLFEKALQ